jgi:hypothetical protein
MGGLRRRPRVSPASRRGRQACGSSRARSRRRAPAGLRPALRAVALAFAAAEARSSGQMSTDGGYDHHARNVQKRPAVHRKPGSSSSGRSRELVGQRMQDVERVAHIQALAQPGRARRPRVQAEPLRLVLRPERLDRIGGHRGRGRDVREQLAVRSPELKRAVGLSLDLIALLMHRAVVPATEQRKIRERGWAPVRPMMEVMALPERQPAAREATALVAVVERAPQGRRNRAGPCPDLHGAPVLVVPHHHPARVARQAL